MNTRKILLLTFCLVLSLTGHAKLNVVTTTTTLKSLTEYIGKDKVSVNSITKGRQDPHYVEAKPSYMMKIKRADLVISVGLDLEEGWLPNVVRGGRNPKVMHGAQGYLEVGEHVNAIDVKHDGVDRSQGDVHAKGNPHFLLDPQRAILVAKVIADRLAQLDSTNKSFYALNFVSFKSEINKRMLIWNKRVQASKVKRVVTHHKTLNYFLNRFEIELRDSIEPKPGIPPTAKQILSLIKKMKAEKLNCIFVESFFETSAAKRIAQNVTVTIEKVPTEVNSTDSATDYFMLIDSLVTSLENCSANTKKVN